MADGHNVERPWKWLRHRKYEAVMHHRYSLLGANDEAPVAAVGHISTEHRKLIVRAVNAYEDLLAACKMALPALHWSQTHQPGNLVQTAEAIDAINAAVAKATGG